MRLRWEEAAGTFAARTGSRERCLMSNPEIVRESVGGVWETKVGSGGGGGSQPAGDDGQIQFNDDGEFGASAGLVLGGLAGTPELRLCAVENGTAMVTGNAPGCQLQLVASDGDATHGGGGITLQGGSSIGEGGGGVFITAGPDDADGDGGSITIQGGDSEEGDAGDINITAGHAPAGDGGQLVISGGSGVEGGNLIVQGGAPDGNVQFYSGNSSVSCEINNSGFFFVGTQTTGVAVTAEAIHAALVTLGLITGP